MKLAAVEKKRDALLAKREAERAAVARVVHEIEHGNRAAVLRLFLDKFAAAFKIGVPLQQAHHVLVWDGLLFMVQDLQAAHVIFLYGVDGLHAPIFSCYNRETKRSITKKFKFWTDQQLCALLCFQRDEARLDIVPERYTTADTMCLVFARLPAEDVFSCLLVCKLWAHAGKRDSVWQRRLPCVVPGYTGLAAFVRVYGLTPTTQMGVLFACNAELRDIVMRQMGLAWVQKYKTYLDVYNVTHPTIRVNCITTAEAAADANEDEAEPVLKRVRGARHSCLDFKTWIIVHSDTLRFPNAPGTVIHASLVASIVADPDDEQGGGAIIWVSSNVKPQIRMATIKAGNAKYEKTNVDYLFRRMMLDYANTQ